MEKKIIVLMALSISLLSYADNENYYNQDISGFDFSNISLKRSNECRFYGCSNK